MKYILAFLFLLTAMANAQTKDTTVQNPYAPKILEGGSVGELFKLTQPLPEHQILLQLEGEWKQEIKFYFSGDTSRVFKGQGETINQMVLGYRFLESKSSSIAFGMHISSISYIGYDNRLKKYTIYTMDEMGTYAVLAFGDYDDKAKTLTFTGNEIDPVTQDPIKFIMKYSFAAEDEIEFEVDLISGSKVRKYLEIMFERK
ncbi:MAG: DUF1579 domain-containing protein [Ignavibacteriaceae bacterium]|nr:DUF1579 domain-containing protein [Ignavibacteriaceae bacterium]